MNSVFARLALAPLLLAAGCLLAGCYGAAHNQVSCMVSPEYFTDFKYPQFRVPADTPLRVAAAQIGYAASWWMGVLLGAPLVGICLFRKGAPEVVRATATGYAIALGTAVVVGAAALAYAYATITAESLPQYLTPEAVEDRGAFLRAGTLHNFSYLGGALGGVLAWTIALVGVIRERRRAGRRGAQCECDGS